MTYNNPDAFYHTDRLREQCIAISDARVEFLENTAEKILGRWNKELRDLGIIEDLDLDDKDITILAIEAGVPFDRILYEKAYKHADESGLYGSMEGVE